MSKIDKLYESKFMQKLQSSGNKLASNKVFSAISSGMMGSMGLIMAGAIFMIIATLLNLFKICEITDPLYVWLTTPYNMTMGVLSAAVAFMVGYSYAKSLNMKAVVNGIVTMVLFLLVSSPVQTVTLADGSTMNVLDSTYLGGTGLFTALILPIIAIKIIHFCETHNIAIKMPEVVPQFLADSFSSMIPLIINIILWHGLNTLIKSIFTVPLPAAVMGIISIPLSGLVSVPGMFILVFLSLLLWSFGIHGSAVVFIVIMAPMIQYISGNADLVAAGKEPVFSAVALFGVAACCGGTGNVLPLALMCARSKSQQLKAVGKAGLIPAIFNISEPMAFGVPIMYNPVMAIPFILNPLITMPIVYAGYSIGFFKPGYIMFMAVLPVFAQEFLRTMAWQNLFIPVIAFIIGTVIYYPFFKVYERQLCEKEAESEAL